MVVVLGLLVFLEEDLRLVQDRLQDRVSRSRDRLSLR